MGASPQDAKIGSSSKPLKISLRRSTVCPECGKSSVFRSRRRFPKDHLLSLLGLYPYRCHECNHRYFTRGYREKRELRWARCPRCGATEIDHIAKSKVPLTWKNVMWRW